MQRITCMSCGLARQRPDYYRTKHLQDVYARPFHDFRDTLSINESPSGNLRYCSQCLKHAQVVLTNVLGYDTIRDMLSSEQNHRFKDFGLVHERSGNIWWQVNLSGVEIGRPNQ